jgi:Methyltransferase domain
MTRHRTLIAVESGTGKLRQVINMPRPGGGIELIEISDHEAARIASARSGGATPGMAGPLAGCEFVRAATPEALALRKEGTFACAEPGSTMIAFNRQIAGPWETFRIVPTELGIILLTNIQGVDKFVERVRGLVGVDKPVCLHFGCGHRRIDGFLNIDKHKHITYSDDYFIFDFAEQCWPIADATVDYIYSEDFIEHIPQKSQLAFLAECFRVLRPGCFNRVNTPCLYESMKRNSDFAKGFSGFHFQEYDKWGHAALFTQAAMQELALMIGYRRVFFTGKSRGTSPYAVPDARPGSDRDQVVGNIFADLLK